MTNLFSAFDPSSIIGTRFNWVSSLLVLLVVPGSLFSAKSLSTKAWSQFTRILHTEFSRVFGHMAKPGSTWFIISLFVCIFINNGLGLFPYIFTSTRHMAFALSLALPLWAGHVLLSWFRQPQYALAHLVPAGTPAALISFIVLIEFVRNIIRPITLSVRLMANLTAGHLLLCLLSSNIPTAPGFSVIAMVIAALAVLVVLEVAVSLIQAYVFTLLRRLYLEETQTKTMIL
jgi:F-type H+-transporting ATPase subunit a